jgi:hypothetical protein
MSNRRERPQGARQNWSAKLPEPLERRLNAYALAAGAAGVAALACTQPAEAAPVCKTLSDALRGSYSASFNPAGQALPPFQAAQTTYWSGTTYGQYFWWNRGFLTPNSRNANVMLGSNGYPASVPQGGSIGPGGKFGKGGSYGLLFSYGRGTRFSSKYGGGTKKKHRGNLVFSKGENYFGFEFSLGGKTHYGWLRVHVTFQGGGQTRTQTITHLDAYGYENTPDTAIAAGSCLNAAEIDSSAGTQKGSLGLLALGSEGLSLRRK